ncbi:jg21506 [Pararge aegeria aegeria]|uniref:Jg21506 protein n=1 Tax=Pararge aegeria aegeria TaxID=348720 RepID=A0A8S4RSJ1_9NEOP|nr:jg21506 [Pararge aegeria aegeria]
MGQFSKVKKSMLPIKAFSVLRHCCQSCASRDQGVPARRTIPSLQRQRHTSAAPVRSSVRHEACPTPLTADWRSTQRPCFLTPSVMNMNVFQFWV